MHDYLLQQKEELRKNKRTKLITVLIGFGVLLFLAGIVFGLRSPIFLFTHVRFSGNEQYAGIVEASFRELAQEHKGWLGRTLFQDNNFLGWSTPQVREEFIQKNPTFNDVRIEKDYRLHQVEIAATERGKYALWCNPSSDGSDCWWFDAQGVIFSEAPRTEGQLIHKVIDVEHRDITIGNPIPFSSHLEALKGIFSFVDELGLPSRTFYMADPGLEELHTEGTPQFLFSLRENPSFAHNAIEKLRSELGNLQYVDLRIKNRIYYR